MLMRMKINNITFAILSLGYGGAERVTVNLANKFAEKGYNVTIITYFDTPSAYELSERVRIINCHCNKNNKLLGFLQGIINTRKLVKQINADIVVSLLTQTNIMLILSLLNTRIPLIISERNDPKRDPKKRLYRILRFMFYRFAEGFVFQTEGAKRYFSKNIQRKSCIIHNPVYIRYNQYKNINAREKAIVNVGRLYEQKNQKLLIKAFSKIANEFPEYKLYIYGEGVLRESLSMLIKNLNLENRVILAGIKEDLWDSIYLSSMFVLSSDYEGMPNALMEAMALGLPCVSSDCSPGGPASLINHGKNGLLFPVNDEEKLAECMRMILLDNDLAQSLSLNAKEICNTHSSDKIFLEWENYILKTMEKCND